MSKKAVILNMIIVAVGLFCAGYEIGKNVQEQETIDALLDHKKTLIEYNAYISTQKEKK